ncbi:CheW protein [Stappia sp. 22II-S9-Z10]|nr:CheW protein [Stappia sp. 22II-S9-Z10]
MDTYAIPHGAERVDLRLTAEQPQGPPPRRSGGCLPFVIVDVAGERCAIRLTAVQEIIRVPDLVPVPMGPARLAGIAEWRGTTLPIFSLRRIFDRDDRVHDEQSRVVVVAGERPIGLIVDRVAGTVSAEPHGTEDTTSATAPLTTGMIEHGGEVMMIIDLQRLIGQEGHRCPYAASPTAHGAAPSDATEEAAGDAVHDDTIGEGKAEDGATGDGTTEPAAIHHDARLVCFTVAGEDYAFPAPSVQEILPLPARLAEVPGAVPGVLGVIPLQQRLLPLVSLRRVLGLPLPEGISHHRILVVRVPGQGGGTSPVGVVVDRVQEVLRVPPSPVDALPPAIIRHSSHDAVEALYLRGEGHRLVSVLSPQRLLGGLTLPPLLAAGANPAEGSETDSAGAAPQDEGGLRHDPSDGQRVLVFDLAGGQYGLPISAVSAIVRVPREITKVPRAPSFVEGVANLSGKVIPVVDQRARLGLDRCARSDRQRVIVLRVDGKDTGFIVDKVTGVATFERGLIRPAPHLPQPHARLVSHIVTTGAPERVILLLDMDSLLARNDGAADAVPEAA